MFHMDTCLYQSVYVKVITNIVMERFALAHLQAAFLHLSKNVM